MQDPILSLNNILAQLNAQSSRALEEVLSRHPEKRLPRWRPSWRRNWLHLHSWKRGLFDGLDAPESIGYEVEALRNDRVQIRLLWECKSCSVVCITKDEVSSRLELSGWDDSQPGPEAPTSQQ